MKAGIDPEIYEAVGQAVKVLRSGGLFLYPTDTVWGIGCDACNEDAVRKVFDLKRRADSKSLVLLAQDADMIRRYVDVPEIAAQLVEVNDAPMTIVYPPLASPSDVSGAPLAPLCLAEDGSVGIRIPFASQFCMALLKAFGRPVVSTSANISGEPSPRSRAEIAQEIVTGVDYVVPDACEGVSAGRPSQIIKVGPDGEIKIIRG